MYVGSFYRPPPPLTRLIVIILRSLTPPYLGFCRIETPMFWLEYNSIAPHIEWSHLQVPHGVQKRQSHQQLLDIIGEHFLTQVVNIPTRNDKTLDLLFTNAPSPVNRVKGMPSISQADHDMAYVEYDMTLRLKE